ncbi:hypothetical protein SAMN06295885_1778 [Rathayibacter oskolensis]|uniref:Uncharacterized protein n=1 Tax=Rathayibacter oskolensis TaxID=1891671 RepID=A0A1X7NQP9_9MICO|nr:hypothetical protein SAMN06295885_1778 [Rathayibacter oskolensis]
MDDARSATAPPFPGIVPVDVEPDDRDDADLPRSRRGLLAVGIGIGAAVLVIGGALVAVPLLSGGGADDAPAADPGTTTAAVAWIASSLDPASVLVVEDGLVDQVSEAGFPADTIIPESTLAAAAPDSAWRAADYLLVTPGLTDSASGEVETALANSQPVAAFGSGDSSIEVRRVLDQGTEAAAASAAVLTAARASAGGQLAGNPALTTTPAARALLEAGQVDARLLLLLGQQLAAAPLSVTDFPAGANETEGVRHRLLLSGYNGASVPADAVATTEATAWLGSQTGDFVPTSVESTSAGLLVTFDLDEPSGLLPDAP